MLGEGDNNKKTPRGIHYLLVLIRNRAFSCMVSNVTH